MLFRLKLGTLVLLIGLLFSGCEFKDLTLERVDSFEIGEMSAEGMNGTVRLQISNPNGFAIKVKGADFDIFSNKIQIGKASLEKSFKIKANSSEVYDVKIKGQMKNILAGGLSNLLGALSGKNPKVTFKGELRAGAFLVSKKIPVDVTTEIPLR